MKTKLFIIALFVIALSSCTQYTCPTYSKQDTKQEPVEKIEKENI